MSVAAFFRDARADGAGRLSPQDNADILARFFQLYGYEACSADQLLALADLALRARDGAVARAALDRALPTPGRLHLAYYKLGRLELGDRRRRRRPRRGLRQVRRRTPASRINWMGQARALAALGREAEAAPFAERFAAFGVRPQASDDLAVLAEVADRLFESGERRRAGPIYALLRNLGPFSQKVAVQPGRVADRRRRYGAGAGGAAAGACGRSAGPLGPACAGAMREPCRQPRGGAGCGRWRGCRAAGRRGASCPPGWT